jgi:23S rRNA-/tRNA-specific pseudouridylate synthase
MVFARTDDAASTLSRHWRERDSVKKEYLARVAEWPPYHNDNKMEGRIDLPLAPSEERIKWQVKEDGGKESTTLWKVLGEEGGALVLSLVPVTGRTHQLRIHCAHVGSGIEGDTLYGKNQIEGRTGVGTGTLYLHACKLSFPHPTTDERMEFSVAPSWWSGGDEERGSDE